MTAQPAVGRSAAAVYEQLGPAMRAGDEVYWLLLLLLEAMHRAWAPVEDLVRDDGDTPGWSKAGDVDLCPPAALPWLGMHVGVRPRPELDAAAQRDRIRDRPEWRRCTPDYFRAVAKEHLTGGRRVELYERTAGNPHHALLRVFAAEVLDEPALRAAVDLASGWVSLTTEVAAGQSYDQLAVVAPTYDDATAEWPTYAQQTYSIP